MGCSPVESIKAIGGGLLILGFRSLPALGAYASLPDSLLAALLATTILLASLAAPVLAANPAGGPAVIVVNAATVDHAEDPVEDAAPSVEDAELPLVVAPPDAKANEKAEPKVPATWSASEIANAKARCAVILKRIHAVAIPLPPIKSGACGTPAPVQLISIGKKPEVTLSPPATMTCELAEGLSTWLETSLQPLAKKHLGTEIINFETISDYSCRNAYGRKGNKLSEHGHANALDIRGFTTASGKMVIVLDDWGTTNRDIREQIAAQKALQDKAIAAQSKIDANKLAAQQQAPSIPQAANQPAFAKPLPSGTLSEGLPSVTATIPLLKPQRSLDPQLSIAEPSKLGGPLLVEIASTASGSAKRRFLHDAHASACTIFGTTLGPEANAAHRNHFHVDMAPRKSLKICD